MGERARVAADARNGERLIGRIALEHLAGVHPQLVDRGLHLGMALVGAVAQSDHPIGAALDMIANLLERLGSDFTDASVARATELKKEESMPHVEIELASNGIGVVAIRALHEEQIAELGGVAQQGKLVFAATARREPRLDFAGVRIP